jgi:SAM-dependent methyltransferase
MALVLRRELRLPEDGQLVLPAGWRLYSAESNGAVHAALADAPGYVSSEYWGEGHTPGSLVNGVRHEDLEHLSFADASLDTVLSSDVLEHVPDAYGAHREIFRVLRKGGCHIFTVPFAPGSERDDVRARRVQDRVEYLTEPLYHGDPVRPGKGVLVWRIFGQEMLTRLREVGFAPETNQLHSPRHGIIGAGAIVFVAREA